MTRARAHRDGETPEQGTDGDRLIRALRASLRAEADAARAPRMQAYMKSTMPYWGVPSPAQGRIFRAVFAAHPLADPAGWRAAMLTLWRTAERREERYAAIALADERRYRRFEDLAALPVYEEWIVTGAWWDYVDTIASHRLGALLELEPTVMPAMMRAWATDPVLWKRRAAILCQLRFRAKTDRALLYDCIAPNLEGSQFGREFFIRKAIGWALRTYARVDPDEVLRYVRAHADRLSGLSKREALKHVLSADAIAELR
jgi:3-methyladenine DNA glycosylase AlkD